MIDWLTDPWEFEFMRRALLAGALIALSGGIVGAFVVVKGLAFLSDAVAHTSLTGAAIAFVAGGGSLAISLGAAVAAVVTAVGVALLTRFANVRQDTAIGLLFAGIFALGVLVISSARNYALQLNSFVIGNILGVSSSDLWLMFILAALVVLSVLVFYRELLFVSYDPVMAEATGVRVGLVETGLLALVAITAVIAFRLVGVVLVMAMLVAPAATGALLVRRLPLIMLLGMLSGLLATVAGLYVSFHAGLAAGPAIVSAAVVMFGVVFLFAPRGADLLRVARRAATGV